MPAEPIIIRGLRPIRSTVQIAMIVKDRFTTPTTMFCSRAALVPEPIFLKISVPKYRNTLIPVTCCKTARTIPMTRTIFIPGWKSWPSEPVSWPSVLLDLRQLRSGPGRRRSRG